MTRNYLYIAISFCLLSAFTLPNLLFFNQGLVFIIEEIFGTILLLVGFFIFKNFVKKIILKLNQHTSWSEHMVNRLLTTIGIISASSLMISLALLILGWGFFYLYGEPAFFQQKQEIIQSLNEQSIQLPNFRRHTPQKFSIFHYSLPIIGGSFFLFSILFFTEESFEYNQFKQKQRIVNEQKAKEQALAKASALQNQLNPHFMFNTLNVLSGLIHEDLEKADKFIKKLSEVYRYVLIQSEEVVTPLRKELEFIHAYTFLLKIRFEEQLKVSINIKEDKLDWLLPSLTLELIVENAIKHNQLSSQNPLVIEIEVKDDSLIIKNNYAPRIDKSQQIGIGIKNLQERLHIIGTKQATFEIQKEKYVATIPLLNPYA